MFKALLKKQLREIGITFLGGSKRSKRKMNLTGAGLIIFAIFLALCFAGLFFMLATQMEAFIDMGFTWMYFVMMGGIALFLAVIGSAFTTFNSMFLAKDNDLLLSMPIPTGTIVSVRVIAVWISTLIYLALVMVPTVIVYIGHGPGALEAVLSVLMIIFLNCLATAISLLLGWLISLIYSRIKNKSYIMVLVAIAFIGAYYYFYFKIMNNISELAAVAVGFAENTAKGGGIAALVIGFGNGLAGNGLPTLILMVICAGLLALILALMARTFIGSMTKVRGEKKKEYVRSTKVKTSGVAMAILKKETKAFTSNAGYMLNSGMGCILTVLFAVFLVIKGKEITVIMNFLSTENQELLGLVKVGIVTAASIISGMTIVAAPAISLEAKTKWLYQSLPIDTVTVVRQKRNLQLILSGVSVLVMTGAICFLGGFPIIDSLLIIVAGLLGAYLQANMHLFIGMVKPNFLWTNEMQVVKQSLAVLLSMGFSFIYPMACIGIYYFFAHEVMSALVYIVVLSVITLIFAILLEMANTKKGRTIYQEQ